MIAHLIHALGAGGPFASRAFLPAFAAALLLRYGVGWVGGEGTQLELAAEVAQQSASWFTHDVTVVVLGLLSLMELFATKNQELRELLGQFDPLLKPVMAGLTALGFTSATDLEIVEASTHALPAGVASGGVFALVAAGGTFVATWIRMEMLEFVEEIDADDSLGIASAISWLEEFWVVALVFLTVVLPFIFLGVVAVSMAVLSLINREFERRAERNKVPCEHCKHLVFASARFCPSCVQARTQVCDVGPFGQPDLRRPVTNPDQQPLRLLSKRRCSTCAGPLTERTPFQVCSSCQRPAFSNESELQSYVAWVSAREAPVMKVCFLLPLVPLLGVIASMVHYRVTLVSPYRRYIPAHRAFLARWSARLVTMFLFAAQCFPGSMSLSALVNHRIYRETFLRHAASAGRRQAAQRDAAVVPVIRWDKALVATLQRQRRPLVGGLLLAALLLPILAVTVLRAAGADALALPRCPGATEQIVGTWRGRLLLETYEWGGRYTLQVLTPEWLGGAVPETELMTLEGHYRANDEGTLTTTIGSVSRTYTYWVDNGAHLYLQGNGGQPHGYARLGEPPVGVALCPSARMPSPTPPDGIAETMPPLAPVPAAAPAPSTPLAPEVLAPSTPPSEPPPPPQFESVTWLPLQRPWSRLHLETSECDEGAYDHLYEYALPALTWTPPEGPRIAIRIEPRPSPNGPILALVAQRGVDAPMEVLRYGPLNYTSCEDRQATVGYVGVRQDGTLLVSIERLPQQHADASAGRAGHTLRAVVRWNAASARPETMGSWEGRTNETPAPFRVRSR